MARLRQISRLIAIWACICYITTNSERCRAQNQGATSKPHEGHHSDDTCDSDDLNHSILVECSALSCSNPSTGKGGDEIIWPTSHDEIILIQSTRAGDRFSQIRLPNIKETEDEMTKLLNMNTTMNVVSSDSTRELEGFGATLDAVDLARALEQNLFERLYCLVLDDLFGTTSSSAHLNLVRLHIGEEFIRGQHNLSDVLMALDRQLKRHSASLRVKVRLVIEFDDIETTVLKTKISDLAGLRTALTNVEIWLVALRRNEQGIRLFADQTFPGAFSFATTISLGSDDTLALTAPDKVSPGLHNILVHAQPSVPYDAIEAMSNRSSTRLLTVGYLQPKTKDYGDWHNANQVAAQILNNLRYGSQGFIEDLSVVHVLALESGTSSPRDTSLYSLHQSHGVHFKGPRFYAMGHFSRYLKPGATRAKIDVFTQPNMFAAHYSAFVTRDRKYLVAVVLNDNEHMLTFRLSYDRVVMAFTNLQPKSFNTFLIKLD